MKKIFITMFLAFAIVFVVGNSAEARDVFIGRYSDGDEVYLMTETVQRLRVGAGGYNCTVKVGYGSRFTHINYGFFAESDGWNYRNSEGYRGRVYDGSSPIAARICDYLRRNF